MKELFEVNMYGDFHGEQVLIETLAAFDTEEKGNKLKEALDNMDYVGKNWISYYDDQWIEVNAISMTDDDVDTVITRYQAIIDKQDKQEREQKRAEMAKDVNKAKEAIALMNRIKEIFAPFDLYNHFTKDEFKKYAPALHKAIVDAKLNIHLFDGTYDYNSDGTVEKWNGRERINYFPIRVHCDTGMFEMGLFYNYGNYDIDDDIRIHEDFVKENS